MKMKRIKKLKFSVGEGINDLIRQAFWYEGKFDWADVTLDCFDGITREQKDMILNGDAFLKPGKDDLMDLIIQEDVEFKSTLKEHQSFIAEQIPKLENTINNCQVEIDRLRYSAFNYGDAGGKQNAANLLEEGMGEDEKTLKLFEGCREKYEDMNSKSMLPEIVPLNDGIKTIELAGYKVPEDLLDEYANHVVKRLRGSLRMASMGLPAIDDPLKVTALEERRQELHGLILHSIGLIRKDKNYYNFAKALEKYLEDHGAGLILGD